MYPRIPAAPRFAAHCSNRIEINPSRRAAVVWFGWLTALCAAIFLGVALPLHSRLAICLGLAGICLPVCRSCFLLLGTGAIRCLEWSEHEPDERKYTAYLGPALIASPARLEKGSFRLGNEILVLRLATAFGVRLVLIDSSVQDPAPFRRLCRYLKTRPRRPPQGLGPPS